MHPQRTKVAAQEALAAAATFSGKWCAVRFYVAPTLKAAAKSSSRVVAARSVRSAHTLSFATHKTKVLRRALSLSRRGPRAYKKAGNGHILADIH